VFPNHDVELATPNELELAAMHEAAVANGYMEGDDWWTVIDSYGITSSGIDLRLQSVTSRALIDKGIPQQMTRLLPFIPVIITKLGAQGMFTYFYGGDAC
jgi:pseudouridine-5'-phosphate glycosidase/pseudouridine kinase